jgi:hypothetical protein
MTQAFAHPVWKREVIVDDHGLSERCAGTLAVFMPWAQVERLGTSGARSRTGMKISL